MPRGIKKENLPSKVCLICQRPFTWRKKWERSWDEITTCSKSCNAKRRQLQQQQKQQDAFTTTTTTTSMLEANRELIELEIDTDFDDGGESIVSASSSFDDAFSCSNDLSSNAVESAINEERAFRKAAKKERKAERRAIREGRADPTHGQKRCDVCDKSVDLLVRCQVDATLKWTMVCGKCWHAVSGGVVDGNPDTHPYYRYGGLWKNRAKR